VGLQYGGLWGHTGAAWGTSARAACDTQSFRVGVSGLGRNRWRVIMDFFLIFFDFGTDRVPFSDTRKTLRTFGEGFLYLRALAPLRGPHVTRNLSFFGGADWVERDGVSSWIFFEFFLILARN